MSPLKWQLSIVVLALLISVIAAKPAPAPQEAEAADEGPHTLLDIETPNTFDYNSPLQQPDSLRSQPYFDFLSTLYSHDSTKKELFTPYATPAP